MASDLSERVEFRLGRRMALGPPLFFALLLLNGAIATSVVGDPEHQVRWPAVAVLGAGLILLVWRLSGAATTADRNGLVATEVGRPWRLFRRAAVPWREVAAIEAHRYGKGYTPVVHLTDGGWIRLRVPAERQLERAEAAIAELTRWRPDGAGDDMAQVAVPRALARPPARRRRLITAGALLVIAIDGLLFVRLLGAGTHRPAEVMSCAVVPASTVQGLLPGAKAGENLQSTPPAGCRWRTAMATGESTAETTLTVSVYAFGDTYLADSFPTERAQKEAQHVTHPIAGVRGISWSTVQSGVADAEAYAVIGGYRVEAKLHQSPVLPGSKQAGAAKRLDPGRAEQGLAQVVRETVARLRAEQEKGR